MGDESLVLAAVRELVADVKLLTSRVEGVEIRQAQSQAQAGRLSWNAVAAAVGIVLGLLTPIGWAITTNSENRVLASELAMEKRIAPLETKLSLLVALRNP